MQARCAAGPRRGQQRQHNDSGRSVPGCARRQGQCVALQCAAAPVAPQRGWSRRALAPAI